MKKNYLRTSTFTLIKAAFVTFMLCLTTNALAQEHYIFFELNYDAGKCHGQDVYFNNLSTLDTNYQDGYEVRWTVTRENDGYIRKQHFPNEIHSFYEHYGSGSYQVKLEIFDNLGNVLGTHMDYFSLSGVDVVPSRHQVCPNEEVIFRAITEGIYSETPYWLVDNQRNYEKELRLTSDTEGSLDVQYIVPGHACGSEFYGGVEITSYAEPYPNLQFITEPSACINGDRVVMEVKDAPPTSTFEWFVDFTQVTNSTPQYIYTTKETPGTVTIDVKETNICGNTSGESISSINVLEQKAIINTDFDFIIEDILCDSLQVRFRAKTSAHTYQWIVNGTESNVSSDYLSAPYVLPIFGMDGINGHTSLIVNTSCGKSDTSAIQDISIPIASPPPYFTIYPEDYYDDAQQDNGDNGGTGPVETTINLCPDEPVTLILTGQINPEWEYYVTYYNPITYETDTIPFNDLEFIIFQQATEAEYNLEVTAWDPVCNVKHYGNEMLMINVSQIKPNAKLRVWPEQLCPGDRLYVWDDKEQSAQRYSYSVDFGDGNSYNNFKEPKDVHGPLASNVYDTEGSYAVSFSVYDSVCKTGLTSSGTIVVSATADKAKSYFLSNSSQREESPLQMKDASSPPTSGDYVEVKIPVRWPDWVPGTDSNLLLIIYNTSDMEEAGEGMPDFYSILSSPNLQTGDTAVAYIQNNFLQDSVMVFGFVWFCNSEHIFSDDIRVITSEEPDVMMFGIDMLFALPPSGVYMHPNVVDIYANIPSGVSPCSMLAPNQLTGKWVNNSGSILYIDETESGMKFSFYADTFMTDGNLYTYEMDMAPSDYMLEFFDYGNYSCAPASAASLFIDFFGADTFSFHTDEGNGCMDFTQRIEYETFIKENEAFHQRIVCPNELVQFDLFGANQVVWDFGNGITKTGRSVSHRFPDVGQYEILAYVDNRCGQRDTLTTQVNVTDEYAPYADFDFHQGDQLLRNSFVFNAWHDDYYDDNNREESTQYLWVINGDTLQGRNIQYIFPSLAGNSSYDVELIVSNACGTSSAIKTVWVETTQACTNYNGVTLNVTKDLDQWNHISVQANLPAYNSNVSYQLAQGDGNVNWSYNAILNGVNFFYQHEGIYPVTLQIMDFENNCLSVISEKVEVIDRSCTAEFDFHFIGEKQIQLTNLTPDVTSVGWSLGDGATRYGETATHTFAEDGIYQVCMQATTLFSSCNACKTVFVGNFSQGCDVSFTAEQTDLSVSFTPNVISDGNVALFWELGNGKTSTAITPSSTYSQAGQYEVCVTIQNNEGCIARYCDIISVGQLDCQADFNFFVEPANKVRFTNASTGNIDGYMLDFGNNRKANKVDTTFQYSRSGSFDVCLTVYNSLNNCQSTRCKKVSIGDTATTALVADFSYIPSSANPKTYSFSSSSTGSPSNFYWTFGDGSMQEGAGAVSHSYEKAGTYQTCLTINNFNGTNAETMQTSQKCYNISVSPDSISCSAKASFNYFVNTAEQKVIFNNASTGDINKFFWNFGNGQSSISHSPTASYDKPGFYLVSLSVMDESGSCVDYTARFIQIGSIDCAAEFATNFGPATNQVNFINQAEGNIFNYYWDFGNGNISFRENPTQFYGRSGIYPVQFTVSDNTGTCVHSRSKPVQVGTVSCHADFSVYVDSLTNTAYFTSDVLGDATNYYWVFGDGKISTEADPVHQFTRSGYFNVSLSVLDENSGCIHNSSQSLMIGEQGLSCKANFNYVVQDGYWVDFYDQSLGAIQSRQWHFGDTVRSIEENPTQQFQPGYHNVCLYVENTAGIGNLHCEWIKVTEENDSSACKANFDLTVKGKTVQFSNTSMGQYQQSHWHFDDGSTSTDNNPVHTYTDSGYYRVSLFIEDTTKQCASKHVRLVNAGAPDTLQAAFTSEAREQQLKVSGYPVDFVGISHGDAAKIRWDFGDGNSDSTSMTPTHYYEQPGNYTACLTVSDPITGIEDEYCDLIKVGSPNSIVSPQVETARLSAYPNPFIDYTTISYELAESGQLSLGIYNTSGIAVHQLSHTYKKAGQHTLVLDGNTLTPGIYYIKLQHAGQTIINKLVRY